MSRMTNLFLGGYMALSVQQIKYDLLAYMKEFGGGFCEWYVGVAEDAEQTLFESHGLDRDRDLWIYRPALTERATETVLRYFMDILQTAGDFPDQIPPEATIVFAYRKVVSCRPDEQTRYL
ncbi:MAG: hypothetical protein ACYC3O_01870 [Burkholderiales bacterium]